MGKRILSVLAGCIVPWTMACAGVFSGEYSTEWQWNMKDKTNWVNLLRLDLDLPLWRDGRIVFSTIHIARTRGERIAGDLQVFSNIEEESRFAAVAVGGLAQTFGPVSVFAGIRNVNEDFFVSECTSLFTNSSCGIFPTISANYPIANYPESAPALHFDFMWRGWTFKNSFYGGVRHEGVFDIMQLEFASETTAFFAGVALHDRLFPSGSEPGGPSSGGLSAAWWLYVEQRLCRWKDRALHLMVQYSENTWRMACSRRYGEAGLVCSDACNRVGLSLQYAEYRNDAECSLELTWKRELGRNFSFQPAFQYIRNRTGEYAVLQARLYYEF